MILWCFIFILSLSAQVNEFSEPWKDTSRAIIIDFYSGNEVNWEEMKKDNRLVAIIHKASQGFKIDPKYKERRAIALSYGYKWGSYHLGTPGDPIEQADHYLNVVGKDPNELLALDLESDDSAKHMNIPNAIIFINRIYEKTGRYPVVYCNGNMLNLINKNKQYHTLFSQCKLWYARFRKDIPDFKNDVWQTYTLWQFSSEINCNKTSECLYNVPGTRFDMDVNIYNGSKAEFLSQWPF
jgi:lysozyme